MVWGDLFIHARWFHARWWQEQSHQNQSSGERSPFCLWGSLISRHSRAKNLPALFSQNGSISLRSTVILSLTLTVNTLCQTAAVTRIHVDAHQWLTHYGQYLDQKGSSQNIHRWTNLKEKKKPNLQWLTICVHCHIGWVIETVWSLRSDQQTLILFQYVFALLGSTCESMIMVPTGTQFLQC